MNKTTSKHYDDVYFNWQMSIGEFGGWANLTKFNKYIKTSDVVLDYGCGGGYLLKNINCSRKIGVEVNKDARNKATENGIEVYPSLDKIDDESLDVVISNHALEHVHHPLDELISIFRKLKKNGIAVFVVPCESISYTYHKDDINQHLYSWSPMALGNLFTEAGFTLVESRPYIHKWPPKFRIIARLGGRWLFDLASRIYARIERSWFQVRVIATK